MLQVKVNKGPDRIFYLLYLLLSNQINVEPF